MNQQLTLVSQPPAVQSKERIDRWRSILEEMLGWLDQPSKETEEYLDRFFHGMTARRSMGISPAAIFEAYNDWLIHLAVSPGKQWRLTSEAVKIPLKLLDVLLEDSTENHVDQSKSAHDSRFQHEDWQHWPFNLFFQQFLITQNWWEQASTGVRGVSKHHENIVEFSIRQWLDIFSPSNSPFTNPQVLKKTTQEFGTNMLRGYGYWLADIKRSLFNEKPVGTEAFEAGKNLALTPGKVVYRNRLIELIQYLPTTDSVHPEPILIVPAWIMKYYILDLSSHNSMIAYLVSQGFTVFTISWHNPGEEDRDLSMEDYRLLGVEAALNTIQTITRSSEVHGIGYCLGGTLLSMAAATQAREKQERFKTLCLLAAQIDFSEAGEILLFIDQSQIASLDDMMWTQGQLNSWQMAGAFQLLRSRDLIWSRMVHEYLMGERPPVNDLMAWNADATRMPYTMHSEYLYHLFLNNEFSRGHYLIEGRPISISDIRAPIFCVGTEKDHVAPWRSVYKIHLYSDTDVTFLLTSGGHNAGIVSEPGHPHRHYRVATRSDKDTYLDPDHWFAQTPLSDGSWWPEYTQWLKDRSSELVEPPAMGAEEHGLAVLGDAPGTYIFEN